MKSFLLAAVLCCFIQGLSLSQCIENNEVKVLLVGDSWANFIGTDQVINTSFTKWGHSNYKYYTNAILAENGTQTIDFLQPVKLNEIAAQLNANPTVEIVHLSIGGNDVLNDWNKNWSQAKTDSLLDSVYTRLVTLIDFIKVNKPGVKILWSGYAYPNFGEIINGLAPFQTTHPYYPMWTGMGSPTFTELNGILNYFSDTISALAASDPQIDFVNATGIMQYAFGQATNLGVPPGGNYPALTAPLPIGYPNYPSPKTCMRTYIIFDDCFHLSPAGFGAFLDYQTRKYYQKELMDDQYLISEGGTKDGSVSSLGSVSTVIQMGENAQEEFSAALSFNTTLMPDTGVSKASIFLRRSALTGTNPISASMQVKIVSGNFGATVDVEAADYNDIGNASDIPCQFGSTAANDHWIRLDLPTALLPYISHLNTTQFIISPAPSSGGLITFNDASDPELAPVLNLVYGPAPLTLPEIYNSETIYLYPNPTPGQLNINKNNINIIAFELFDIMGKNILQIKNPGSVITDISHITPGVYFVKITSATHTFSRRIIKQ